MAKSDPNLNVEISDYAAPNTDSAPEYCVKTAKKRAELKNHTPSMWVFYSAEEDQIVILIPICFWFFGRLAESEEFLDSPDAYLCEMAQEDGSTVYVHVNKETVAENFEIVGVF